MTMLQTYLDTGEASVAAFRAFADGQFYEKIADQPSIVFAWDPKKRLFCYIWAGEARPHMQRIDRVTEQAETVTMKYDGGKIELSPIIFDDERGIIEAWQADPNYDEALQAERVQWEIANNEIPRPLKREQLEYEVMLEYRGGSGEMEIVGAYAANDDEIVWWPLPGDEAATSYNDTMLQDATAPPLDLLAYLWEAANGITVSRGRLGTIKATDATAAAQKAALRNQPDPTA